ncbi:MAG: VOC family protein [Parvularculaceae bacterium]
MLHHISFPVSDLARATALYDAALGALGFARVCTTDKFSGYGAAGGEDVFGLFATENAQAAGAGFHLAFAAPSRDAVDRFHAAAIKHGARDNGAPGLREKYGPDYYAAFVIDLDGHRLEAVFKGA